MIESDNRVWRLKQSEAFTPPMNGWFMSDALYMRYQKSVADRLQELQVR